MTSPSRSFSFRHSDGTVKTAEEIQAEADRLLRDARERADRLKTGLAENEAEATSRNQAATVTVGATGNLKSVRLNDRVKGMGPAMIAESVMEAYRAASVQVAARTREVAAASLGNAALDSLLSTLVPESADDRPDAHDGRFSS